MIHKGLLVDDTQITAEKLKWTMGNLKQPKWSVPALGVANSPELC